MPIFEYLCQTCNRIYSFLSMAPVPTRIPTCPRCGATDLKRVPSTFAVQAPRKTASTDAGAAVDDDGTGPVSATEAEAMRILEGLDDDQAENPRVMARVMRQLAEASGEPMTPTMEEMFRRMEAGEDPEALEDELGEQLEAEMGSDSGGPGGPPARDEGLYSL